MWASLNCLQALRTTVQFLIAYAMCGDCKMWALTLVLPADWPFSSMLNWDHLVSVWNDASENEKPLFCVILQYK